MTREMKRHFAPFRGKWIDETDPDAMQFGESPRQELHGVLAETVGVIFGTTQVIAPLDSISNNPTTATTRRHSGRVDTRFDGTVAPQAHQWAAANSGVCVPAQFIFVHFSTCTAPCYLSGNSHIANTRILSESRQRPDHIGIESHRPSQSR